MLLLSCFVLLGSHKAQANQQIDQQIDVGLQLGAVLWQETFNANLLAEATEMRAELLGQSVGVSVLTRKADSKWSRRYDLELLTGQLRGTTTASTARDRFTSKAWSVLGFHPGAFYHTSETTAVGFKLPISYRSISWDLDSVSEFTEASDRSVSVGVAVVIEHQMAQRHYFLASLTMQMQWAAQMWQFVYKYKF